MNHARGQRAYDQENSSPKMCHSPEASACHLPAVSASNPMSTEEHEGIQLFKKHQVEATQLAIRKNFGTCQSEDHERLAILQAKMEGFWNETMRESSSEVAHLSDIPFQAQPVASTLHAGTTKGSTGHRDQNQEISNGRAPSSILQEQDANEDTLSSGTAPKNHKGLPDYLKRGVERLSGMPMDDVRVHHRSAKPAQFRALAYTQGTEIYLGSGQEIHLPHEAWHVVQQKQGRVRPTTQMKGMNINDDARLEREADIMGYRAEALGRRFSPLIGATSENHLSEARTVQRKCAYVGTSSCSKCGADQIRSQESRSFSEQRRALDHALPPSNVLQLRRCADGNEYSTQQPSRLRNSLRAATGMEVTAEEAHILCCSFCKAQISSITNSGPADPASSTRTRYTNLFDRFVPLEVTAGNLPATTSLYLEESYFIDSVGGGASLATTAHLTTLQGLLNGTLGGVPAPADMPAPAAAEYGAIPNPLPAPAGIPIPAGSRSNSRFMYLASPIYELARLLDRYPSTAPGLGGPWDTARAAAGGRLRASDVSIDRGAAYAAAGGDQSSILDAKFSYPRGRYDNWGPGQQADLLTAYAAAVPSTGAAIGVPIIDKDTCACDLRLMESQNRKRTRSQSVSGGPNVADRTRGATSRKKRKFDDQETNRKRARSATRH